MIQELTDNTLFPLMWGAIEPLEEGETLEKALSDGELDPAWLMKGMASAEILDEDGQVLVQDGMDWGEYDARGIVHYRHPYSAERVCGQGVSRTPGIVNGYPANEVVVALIKGLPLAESVRKQHIALCKGPRRQGLGFSVEGAILEMRGNRITRSKVRTLAIDAAPRNPVSFAAPLTAALGGAFGYRGGFPNELAKAAMALAYDPDVKAKFDVVRGTSLQELLAQRFLFKSNPKLALAALERVAGVLA